MAKQVTTLSRESVEALRDLLRSEGFRPPVGPSVREIESTDVDTLRIRLAQTTDDDTDNPYPTAMANKYPIALGSAEFSLSPGQETVSFSPYTSPTEYRVAKDTARNRFIAPDTLVIVALSHGQWHILATVDDHRYENCVWVKITTEDNVPWDAYTALEVVAKSTDNRETRYMTFDYDTDTIAVRKLIGVAQWPVTAVNQIIPVQLSGVTPLYMNIVHRAHTRGSYNSYVGGQVDTNMHGPFEIISKPDELSNGTNKLCIVRIGTAPVVITGRVVSPITAATLNNDRTTLTVGSGIVEIWQKPKSFTSQTFTLTKLTDGSGNRVLQTVYNMVEGADTIQVNAIVAARTHNGDHDNTNDDTPIVDLSSCVNPPTGTGAGSGGGGTTPETLVLYPTAWEPNDNGTGEATWSGNQDAAQDDDGDYASTTLATSGTTQRSVKAGFANWVDSLGNPPNLSAASLVVGFTVTVRAFQTVGADTLLSEINMYFGASTGAVTTDVALSATETAYTYGSSTSLFGFTPTPGDINGGSWGIELEAYNQGAASVRTVNIEQISVTVHYYE